MSCFIYFLSIFIHQSFYSSPSDMFDFVPYLSFLTSGIGVLFSVYLFLRFRTYPKVYWLILLIFSLVFLEFYIFALTSKQIYQMLFLLRVPNIVRAFVPTLLYFYVWTMLHPKQKWKSYQYLHFLFPLVILIGVMPDILMSDSEKRAIIDGYYEHNNFLLKKPAGWIPPGMVQPVSILFGISYGVYCLWMIYQSKKRYASPFAFINKQSLIWLQLLSAAVMLYFLLQFYQYLTLVLGYSFDPPSQIFKCTIAISLFTYFMSSPNVQENMDGCIIPNKHENETIVPPMEKICPQILPNYQQDEAIQQTDRLMKESYCYLNPECDLTKMAKMVDQNPLKFSKYIKTYYGISFVEFLNRLKIHYFLTHVDHVDQFTLETYIYQSGFANRSTFYVAFKKYVGVNPSFYLKELKGK